MDSISTPFQISSDLILPKASSQCKQHKKECAFESETDANYSSSLSSDDEDESVADSDLFFNVGEVLNREEDDDQEGYSYTTGGGEMQDLDEEDDTATTYRGVKKEKVITCEEGLDGEIKDEEEEERLKRNRKREEDKAFWEACLASGY